MTPITLNQLRDGEAGIVIGNSCASRHSTRLAELGLAAGETVHVVSQGSSMLLQIGDTRLCLRSESACDVAIVRTL